MEYEEVPAEIADEYGEGCPAAPVGCGAPPGYWCDESCPTLQV
jgi:hypothetical protein